MKNIQATGNVNGKRTTIKQISKAEAVKLFAQGIEIYLQSSNMRPFGVWQSVCPIKLDTENLESEKKHYEWCKNGGYELPVHPATEAGQFTSIINDYRYYNCDNQRGKYIHYYKTV